MFLMMLLVRLLLSVVGFALGIVAAECLFLEILQVTPVTPQVRCGFVGEGHNAPAADAEQYVLQKATIVLLDLAIHPPHSAPCAFVINSQLVDAGFNFLVNIIEF